MRRIGAGNLHGQLDQLGAPSWPDARIRYIRSAIGRRTATGAGVSILCVINAIAALRCCTFLERPLGLFDDILHGFRAAIPRRSSRETLHQGILQLANESRVSFETQAQHLTTR